MSDDPDKTLAQRVEALPRLIATAPERIYIQVSEEAEAMDEPFPPPCEDITWCPDSVIAAEVPYVRADLIEAQASRIAELEADLAKAIEQRDVWHKACDEWIAECAGLRKSLATCERLLRGKP